MEDNPTFCISRKLDTLDTGWISLPGPYLLYAKVGTFHLELHDRQWLLPPQRAAWIPPNTPLRILADHPIESASILYSTDSGVEAPSRCCVFSVSPLGREMIVYSTRWTEDTLPHDARAEGFFRSVAEVFLELAATPDQLWLPLVQSTLLKRAMDHVLNHLGDPLTTDSVAQLVHCTTRTLSRKFINESEMTLGQFIQRARILRAMELLAQSDMTVLEIVYAVGLNSVGSFEVSFRKIVQESPLQYRKRLLSGSPS